MDQSSTTKLPCCAVSRRLDASTVARVDAALETLGQPGAETLAVIAAWPEVAAAGLSKPTLSRHRTGCPKRAPGEVEAVAPVSETVAAQVAETVETVAVKSIETHPPAPLLSRARMKSQVKREREIAPIVSETAETRETVGAQPACLVDSDEEPRFSPVPPDRIGRVEAVERMMLELRWEKGITGPQLSTAWGLTEAAISNYANEAWRNIKRNIDPASVKDMLGAALWRATEDAKGDPKAVATVAKAYAELAGLVAGAKTLQIEVVTREPWFQEMISAVLGSIQKRAPEILPGVREDLQAFLASRGRPALRSIGGGWAA